MFSKEYGQRIKFQEHWLKTMAVKNPSALDFSNREELIHLKRLWCWERLRAGGEGYNRGWDSWMASSTQWTWVWVNSDSWWWTGRPGVLQSMGLQRVRHNWATVLTDLQKKNKKQEKLTVCLLKAWDTELTKGPQGRLQLAMFRINTNISVWDLELNQAGTLA